MFVLPFCLSPQPSYSSISRGHQVHIKVGAIECSVEAPSTCWSSVECAFFFFSFAEGDSDGPQGAEVRVHVFSFLEPAPTRFFLSRLSDPVMCTGYQVHRAPHGHAAGTQSSWGMSGC